MGTYVLFRGAVNVSGLFAAEYSAYGVVGAARQCARWYPGEPIIIATADGWKPIATVTHEGES